MTQEEMAAWVAAQRNKPVWRDGLCSRLSYVIIAVHQKADQYTCVAVRKLGHSNYKVKFYPDLGTWNLTESELRSKFYAESFCDRTNQGEANYYRVRMNDAGLMQLVDFLKEQRNTAVAPAQEVLAAFHTSTSEDKQEGYKLHPIRGGGIPKPQERLMFVPPVLLAAPGTRSNPVKSFA